MESTMVDDRIEVEVEVWVTGRALLKCQLAIVQPSLRLS
jgi:hypothetical protein